MKAFLSVKEFSKITGLHPNTIRSAIRKKNISAFKINQNTSGWRIPSSEAQRLCEMHFFDKGIDEK